MGALEVLLQLGTVFFGAFLAFVLENFRERRQLRGWADDYLRRVRLDLQESNSATSVGELNGSIAAYEAFVARAKGSHVPSEAEWNSLMGLKLEQHVTYQALTESAAARVLPAELVQTLDALDDAGQAVDRFYSLCHQAWEQYTVPVVLEMKPISDAERRGLEYVGQLLRMTVPYIEKRRALEVRVLELLDKHGLGR